MSKRKWGWIIWIKIWIAHTAPFQSTLIVGLEFWGVQNQFHWFESGFKFWTAIFGISMISKYVTSLQSFYSQWSRRCFWKWNLDGIEIGLPACHSLYVWYSLISIQVEFEQWHQKTKSPQQMKQNQHNWRLKITPTNCMYTMCGMCDKIYQNFKCTGKHLNTLCGGRRMGRELSNSFQVIPLKPLQVLLCVCSIVVILF